MAGRHPPGGLATDPEANLNARTAIRVLHLRDSPWLDGPGRTILETATHIDRARIDYHVGVLVGAADGSHPLMRALCDRGLPAHEIMDDGSSMRAVAQRVNELIDALDIEILHASEFRSSIVSLICRRRRPLWLVRTAHGWITNDLRGTVKSWIDRLLIRCFDRVVVVSHATRRRVPRWWVRDGRIRVLHNSLVLDEEHGASGRAAQVASDPIGSVTLLNVGRLSPEKGQDLLLRAFATLAPQYPQLRLVIAGKGPLESDLRNRAAELGVADRINFVGYVLDMTTIYQAVDLVVQSSFTEGLPNVILEAAYAGVPIVATDVGGTSEVIDHQISGWLIRPRRLDQLVEGIRQFLERPAQFKSMADAARARITGDFSFKARTAAQMNIYEEIGVQNRGRRRER